MKAGDRLGGGLMEEAAAGQSGWQMARWRAVVEREGDRVRPCLSQSPDPNIATLRDMAALKHRLRFPKREGLVAMAVSGRGGRCAEERGWWCVCSRVSGGGARV